MFVLQHIRETGVLNVLTQASVTEHQKWLHHLFYVYTCWLLPGAESYLITCWLCLLLKRFDYQFNHKPQPHVLQTSLWEISDIRNS